jgi:hypothetical protein
VEEQFDIDRGGSPGKFRGMNMNFLKGFAKAKVDEEKKRQEDLQKELEKQAHETVPDIIVEVPVNIEPDSDEIRSDEWPDPRPEPIITVYDD